MDSRCFFFVFFFLFLFERERVLFSGTKKKTLWKERDERETRRDCLGSSFFLDNTIAVVSPINTIFSHKRHKNHFYEAKKARAVLVPKATTTTKTTTHTPHGTLLSLGGEKKEATLRVCFCNTAERRRRRMIARALRREARKALSTTTRREALTVRLPPPFFVYNRIVVRISWHRIGNTKCRCRNRPRLPFFFRARLCARSPPVSLSVRRTRRERIFFRAHQRTNTNTNNRERLPPRRPRRTTPPTRTRTPNSNQASRGRKPVTTI